MSDSRDIDFQCWFCGDPFSRGPMEEDALLIPRRRDEGGPYFLTTCRGCEEKSRVERNLAGAYLAGPIPPVPLIDGFLAQFDPSLRRALSAKKEHIRRRRGRRDWFFEVYEQELLAAAARTDRQAKGDPKAAEPRAAKPPHARREAPPPRAADPEPKAASEEPFTRSPQQPPPSAAPSAHEVLGLEHGADADAALKAFKELAKRYHPDRFEALDAEFKELAHRKFIELKAALDELRGAQE